MRLQILQILQNLPDFENATQPSNHKGLRQNPKYQFIELRVPKNRTESTKKSKVVLGCSYIMVAIYRKQDMLKYQFIEPINFC